MTCFGPPLKPSYKRWSRSQRIRQRLIGIPPGIPKDVIVVTPEHFERHKDTIGFIVRPALREGRVLHVA